MGGMEQTVNELEHPQMRDELLLHVSHLADPEYQRKVWVQREFPKSGYYDDFDTTFEALEDIVPLSNADNAVGITLRDSREALTLKALGSALDHVFATYGTTLTDAEYLALPEWTEVVQAAQQALNALSAADQEED